MYHGDVVDLVTEHYQLQEGTNGSVLHRIEAPIFLTDPPPHHYVTQPNFPNQFALINTTLLSNDLSHQHMQIHCNVVGNLVPNISYVKPLERQEILKVGGPKAFSGELTEADHRTASSLGAVQKKNHEIFRQHEKEIIQHISAAPSPSNTKPVLQAKQPTFSWTIPQPAAAQQLLTNSRVQPADNKAKPVAYTVHSATSTIDTAKLVAQTVNKATPAVYISKPVAHSVNIATPTLNTAIYTKSVAGTSKPATYTVNTATPTLNTAVYTAKPVAHTGNTATPTLKTGSYTTKPVPRTYKPAAYTGNIATPIINTAAYTTKPLAHTGKTATPVLNSAVYTAKPAASKPFKISACTNKPAVPTINPATSIPKEVTKPDSHATSTKPPSVMSLNAKDLCKLQCSDYSKKFSANCTSLWEAHDLVDVTLGVEGRYIQAHKLVLSVCSDYFKELFKINPCQHPIVILTDVDYECLNAIVKFMYCGEVQLTTDKLSDLIRVAQLLKVKGMYNEADEDEVLNKEPEESVTSTPSPNQTLVDSKEPSRSNVVNAPRKGGKKRKVYTIPPNVKLKILRCSKPKTPPNVSTLRDFRKTPNNRQTETPVNETSSRGVTTSLYNNLSLDILPGTRNPIQPKLFSAEKTSSAIVITDDMETGEHDEPPIKLESDKDIEANDGSHFQFLSNTIKEEDCGGNLDDFRYDNIKEVGCSDNIDEFRYDKIEDSDCEVFD